MKPAKFAMSSSVAAKLMACMEPLRKEQRTAMLDALGELCAEVQMHCYKLVSEELRQQWSDVLNTTLLIEPRKRGAQ